jgi:hypothetical protein
MVGYERKADAKPGMPEKALVKFERLAFRFGGNCDGR